VIVAIGIAIKGNQLHAQTIINNKSTRLDKGTAIKLDNINSVGNCLK
jgi:hypothetical protein